LAETTQFKVGLDTQNNVHTGRTGAAPGYMGDYTLKPRIKDAEFKNVGVFGEAAHQLGEGSRVIGGLRVDSWKAQDARAQVYAGMMGMTLTANPTANHSRSESLKSGFLRYEREVLNSSATLYAGLGRTERAPDYWELIGKETATSLSAFDTARSEKTTQLDIGLTIKQGDMSGSLSGFYNKITDFNLIESGCKSDMMNAFMGLGSTCAMGSHAVSMTRNVNATTFGAEAGAIYQLAENWKMDGNLAYVRGSNDTDGTALAQIPPLEARIGLNYDDKIWSFGGLLRVVAAQNRVAVNQGNIAGRDIAASSGFSVFSINAGWRANKTVQVTAGVDNAFNKTYAEHISRAGTSVSGYTQTTRINEMGRNVWAKANFDF
jgi:iron complex outermembrane receptor protein